MPVRLVVAVTDWDWFNNLRQQTDLAEINFWSPSARPFKALQEGELFLFKLHALIDIHSLFDLGYLTVTPDHHVEVSRKIREEFQNGREYYALHGSTISLPGRDHLRPDSNALAWHNEHKYLG